MKKDNIFKLIDVIKKILLLILVSVTIFYTIPWTLSHLSSPKSYPGIDLHAYWYSGLYFRQHTNPYAAILNNPSPNYWDPRYLGSGDPHLVDNSEYSLNLPIEFLGGEQISLYPVAQVLITPPSVTAPLALLLWLLSWVSWPLAQLLWAIINFIVVAFIPWLALRLPSTPFTLRSVDKLIFAFIFYNLYGVRQGIILGQQTLVCLFLLIISLNLRRNWLISGVLFGLALSKYSVALPFFVFYLMYRKYRILMTGIVIQLIGILLLMPLKWGSPFQTITAYLKVLDIHKGQTGVQIPSTFSGVFLPYFLVAIVMFITLYFIFQHFRLTKFSLVYDLSQLNKLNLLILATLLTTYHRIYDTSLIIFFFLLMLIFTSDSKRIILVNKRSFLKVGCLFIGVFLLIYPTLLQKLVARMGISSVTITWVTPESVSSIVLLIFFLMSSYMFLKVLWKNESVKRSGRIL